MVREARVPAGKVLSAPWTPEGAAAARADALADAAKQAKAAKKRKRSNWCDFGWGLLHALCGVVLSEPV
jgi:hypothetical protein